MRSNSTCQLKSSGFTRKQCFKTAIWRRFALSLCKRSSTVKTINSLILNLSAKFIRWFLSFLPEPNLNLSSQVPAAPTSFPSLKPSSTCRSLCRSTRSAPPKSSSKRVLKTSTSDTNVNSLKVLRSTLNKRFKLLRTTSEKSDLISKLFNKTKVGWLKLLNSRQENDYDCISSTTWMSIKTKSLLTTKSSRFLMSSTHITLELSAMMF